MLFPDVCPPMGIRAESYYAPKKRYAETGLLEVRALRQLRDSSVRRQHLRDPAASRPRFGLERLHRLLRREGLKAGHTRFSGGRVRRDCSGG